MARGIHLFPFRTEKLSPSAPMVLGAKAPGRVGRRRIQRHGVGTFGCRPRSSSSSKADSWTGQGAGGAPNPVGPIWLGYYRSENGGASFRSSLVPGWRLECFNVPLVPAAAPQDTA